MLQKPTIFHLSMGFQWEAYNWEMAINKAKYPISSAIEKQLGKNYPNPCLITNQEIVEYVELVNKPLTISLYELENLPKIEQDKLTKAPAGFPSILSWGAFNEVNIKKLKDAVQRECLSYRISALDMPPIPANLAIQFTDSRLGNFDVRVLKPELREQIRPAFISWENAKLRVDLLKKEIEILNFKKQQYESWIFEMETGISKDNSDVWDSLIFDYGATCIPIGTKDENDFLLRGSVWTTGKGYKFGLPDISKYGDNLCINKSQSGMFAESVKSRVSPFSRGYQLNQVYARLSYLKNNEIPYINGKIRNIEKNLLPSAENKLILALNKWQEIQALVVRYLTYSTLIRQEAERAATMSEKIEAERKQKLLEEQTKRDLARQNFGIERTKDQKKVLIGGALFLVGGLAAINNFGGESGKIISILVGLGGAFYALNELRKSDSFQIKFDEENIEEEESIISQVVKELDSFGNGNKLNTPIQQANQNKRFRYDQDDTRVNFSGFLANLSSSANDNSEFLLKNAF